MTADRVLSVLFVINSLGAGGAERSLAELLPRLAQAGIRPTIACLRRAGEGFENEVMDRGFDVRFLDGGAGLGKVVALRRLIAMTGPHVVHTAIFESDVAGRIAAAGTGSAVITSLVNTSYSQIRLQDPNIKRSRLEAARMIDGWTARHLTAHFHAITRTVKSAAVAALGIPSSTITVIERGRDPGHLGKASPGRRARVRAVLQLGDDQEVLLNVGRQEFQKGQRYLLEAMTLLRDRPRLVLLMAGRQGEASAELHRLVIDRQLEGRVRLLGHREDVPDLLAAADVFVFPSRYEGLGGAVIEAMALGLPVVASRLDALEEVVEDGGSGLLVAPASAYSLAGGIRAILDDKDRARRFGARGREIFAERFTLDRSAERMIALYRRLAAIAARDGSVHRPRQQGLVRLGESWDGAWSGAPFNRDA